MDSIDSVAVSGKPGVRANIPQALHVLTLGCDGGNVDACHDAGVVLLREAHARLAQDGVDTSSTGNGSSQAAAERPHSVQDVSSSHTASAGDAPPRKRPTAAPRTALSAREASTLAERLLRKGCDANNGGSSTGKCCYVLANMYGDVPLGVPAPATAVQLQLLQRACDAENVPACQALARAYASGSTSLNVARDTVAARGALRRAMLLSGASEARADKELSRLLPAEAPAVRQSSSS